LEGFKGSISIVALFLQSKPKGRKLLST